MGIRNIFLFLFCFIVYFILVVILFRRTRSLSILIFSMVFVTILVGVIRVSGVIKMFLKGKLTSEMLQGLYGNLDKNGRSWRLSHLCGNWNCCNIEHMTIEPGSTNASRNWACLSRLRNSRRVRAWISPPTMTMPWTSSASMSVSFLSLFTLLSLYEHACIDLELGLLRRCCASAHARN